MGGKQSKQQKAPLTNSLAQQPDNPPTPAPLPSSFTYRVEARNNDILTEAVDEVGSPFTGLLLLCSRPQHDYNRWLQPTRNDILHQVNFKDGHIESIDQTQANLIEVQISASTDAAEQSSSSSSSSSTFLIHATADIIRGGRLYFYLPWQIVDSAETIAWNERYLLNEQSQLLQCYEITPERLDAVRIELLAAPSGGLALEYKMTKSELEAYLIALTARIGDIDQTAPVAAPTTPAACTTTTAAATSTTTPSSTAPRIQDAELTVVSEGLNRYLHGQFPGKPVRTAIKNF